MKTLIIISHPNIDNSVVHKRWIKELNKHPDLFTIHHLDQAYPDGVINVQKEQKLIENHDALILQFPIFWFNCPPSLKEWLDKVFVYGWAFGSTGKNLVNRKIALAISAGIVQKDYTKTGRYHYTLQEILRPFEVTMNYVQANYQPFFAIYGEEDGQGSKYQWNKQLLEESSRSYIDFLVKLTDNP